MWAMSGNQPLTPGVENGMVRLGQGGGVTNPDDPNCPLGACEIAMCVHNEKILEVRWQRKANKDEKPMLNPPDQPQSLKTFEHQDP